jgi:two-component system sensor histidine kinase AgrC
MLATVLGLIRFGFSLIFGLAVSVMFAGIGPTRKNRFTIAVFCMILIFVQTVTWWFLGLELTSKLYPLIIHLPVIIILSLYYKRPWLISVVSVLSAYLCCQAPRWFGFLAGSLFGSKVADHTVYIATVFLAYYFLKRYVVGSVRELMEKSSKSCLLLGGVPLFYYLFDYITTIYTDVLYQGAEWAVQFMPSIISIFYFVFVILYYSETLKQANLQREQDMLDAQFRQAQREFASLRQMQQIAATYRHDMRHHFTLLQSMASEERIDDIREYLQAARSDIDAITPVRYCENETVNLILSSFAAKANQAGIMIAIDTKLPGSLPFSDTELCSLLSNALETRYTPAEV